MFCFEILYGRVHSKVVNSFPPVEPEKRKSQLQPRAPACRYPLSGMAAAIFSLPNLHCVGLLRGPAAEGSRGAQPAATLSQRRPVPSSPPLQHGSRAAERVRRVPYTAAGSPSRACPPLRHPGVGQDGRMRSRFRGVRKKTECSVKVSRQTGEKWDQHVSLLLCPRC